MTRHSLALGMPTRTSTCSDATALQEGVSKLVAGRPALPDLPDGLCMQTRKQDSLTGHPSQPQHRKHGPVSKCVQWVCVCLTLSPDMQQRAQVGTFLHCILQTDSSEQHIPIMFVFRRPDCSRTSLHCQTRMLGGCAGMLLVLVPTLSLAVMVFNNAG